MDTEETAIDEGSDREGTERFYACFVNTRGVFV
jgi:hypothetical protein